MRRGTNYCARMRYAAVAAANPVIAPAPEVPTSEARCTCGYPYSAHDVDREQPAPWQDPGGVGCLDGWNGERAGCQCMSWRPTTLGQS